MLQRGFIGAQELQLVLGEVAELNAFGEADFTVQRFQFARQQLDQRRFPRAVATQQADTRAGHQVQLDGFQNDAIAITCADFSIFSSGFGRLSGARKLKWNGLST